MKLDEKNPWEEYTKKYKKGDIIEGKVLRLTNFGAFIEIEEGIQGLLHKSEVDATQTENPDNKLVVGSSHTLKIIKISRVERKIGLSIRAVEMEDYESNYSSQGSPNATLGDFADFGTDWATSSRANPEGDGGEK